MSKAIYANNEEYARHRLYNFPSAGPRPNVAGLRKHVYGKNAYLVRHGEYVYNVSQQVYNAVLHGWH